MVEKYSYSCALPLRSFYYLRVPVFVLEWVDVSLEGGLKGYGGGFLRHVARNNIVCWLKFLNYLPLQWKSVPMDRDTDVVIDK